MVTKFFFMNYATAIEAVRIYERYAMDELPELEPNITTGGEQKLGSLTVSNLQPTFVTVKKLEAVKAFGDFLAQNFPGKYLQFEVDPMVTMKKIAERHGIIP